MFSSLATSDFYKICCGVLMLFLIIVIGVGTAERQMNTLTQWHSFGHAFNIRHNVCGVYSAYLFGQGYSFSAVFNLGRIKMKENGLIIESAGQQLYLPTKVYIDIQQNVDFLSELKKEFIEEAQTTKNHFNSYLKVFVCWLHDAIHTGKQFYQSIK